MRRLAGWALLLVGLTMVGVLVVGRFLDDHRTAAAQAALAEELHSDHPTAPAVRRHDVSPVAAPAAEGHALVGMRIPRFGGDWSWVAVEGTAEEDLARGPGHYAATPLPGARGNVAFAGHRAGHGDPFIDFDRLRPGDEVVLSQGPVRWTYRLTTAPEIVPVSASWVLDPLPGRRLTLTTCWPRYGSSKRMFVRGHLVSVSDRGGPGG